MSNIKHYAVSHTHTHTDTETACEVQQLVTDTELSCHAYTTELTHTYLRILIHTADAYTHTSGVSVCFCTDSFSHTHTYMHIPMSNPILIHKCGKAGWYFSCVLCSSELSSAGLLLDSYLRQMKQQLPGSHGSWASFKCEHQLDSSENICLTLNV